MKAKKFINKILSIVLCFGLIVAFVPQSVAVDTETEGSLSAVIDTGREITLYDKDNDTYYEIWNADQLYAFAQIVNNGNTALNIELLLDITVNSNVFDSTGNLVSDTSALRSWIPIGKNGVEYQGDFDGQNHTVSGLFCNDTQLEKTGLFGIIGVSSKVHSLTVADSYFYGEKDTGAIAGRVSGLIENCFNENTTVESPYEVGGIAGDVYSGEIKNCGNNGTVLGGGFTGGIVGYTSSAVIGCYNTGKIGSDRYFGGIAGTNNGTVSRCYVACEIIDLGGYGKTIVAKNYNIIENCYFIPKDSFTVAAPNDDNVTNTESKTAESFASGEVCYLLNNGSSTPIWYQTIGENALPTFSGHTVYNVENCSGGAYSNSSVAGEHTYIDGVCAVCSGYESAVKVDGAYSIGNKGQLLWFAQEYNKGNLGSSANAVLTADIDLSGHNWTPIGTSSRKYYGIFDGQNHSITGFTMHITSGGYYGLFGFANGGGITVIKNFSISGEVTTAFTKSGDSWYGVIGQSDGGATISNVHSSVNYTAGDTYTKKFVGGIVGQTGDITIERSSFSGTIDLGASAVDCVGGIAAYSYNGKTVTINGCGFYGTINSDYTGGASQIGGILGYYNGENGRNLTFSNNLSAGTITMDGATDKAGALVGVLKNYTEAQAAQKLTNLYYFSTLPSCSSVSLSATAVDQEQLSSGEVAYKLQGDNTVQLWGQDIDNGKPKQALPSTNGGKLYYADICGATYGYSNKADTVGHSFINHVCAFCGAYPSPDVTNTEYIISNVGELLWLQNAVNNKKSFYNLPIRLANDIDMNPGYEFNYDGTAWYNGELVTSGWLEWTPIGTDLAPFKKAFNGDYHKIKGVHISSPESKYVGFFGCANGATIENLIITDSYIGGMQYVGGICGQAEYTNIYNCGNEGYVSASQSFVGGICGCEPMAVGIESPITSINNCYNTGEITGDSFVGGIVGNSFYFKVNNCFNTGTVFGTGSYESPIAPAYSGNISNCYYLATEETDDSDATTYKTAEQFASGEVAYLLQKGNTEQVWGQDNNRDGTIPTFDTTTLYKAVKIGDTGNFSVSNIGDTNGDREVDVTDYQALVNTALAGEHDQIESASYDDIIKYDLDGNGYLNVIDASIMERVLSGHTVVDVYAVGDYDMNGVVFEEADILLMEEAIKSPEAMTTQQKYACDLNADGTINDADKALLDVK